MTTYTIGRLAAAAEVPISTVRFYERQRIILPDARTGSNYRAYSAATLDRLRFVRAAQASGFSLKDVREMLSLTHDDKPPCDDVAALIDRRLGEVRGKLRELKRVERALRSAKETCCTGGPDWCTEIERLKGPGRAKAVSCATPPGSPVGLTVNGRGRAAKQKSRLTLHRGATSRLGVNGPR